MRFAEAVHYLKRRLPGCKVEVHEWTVSNAVSITCAHAGRSRTKTIGEHDLIVHGQDAIAAALRELVEELYYGARF